MEETASEGGDTLHYKDFNEEKVLGEGEIGYLIL